MEITSRVEWGARPPLRTPYRPGYTNEVFLHHTAGDHSGAAGMRSMQQYHQSADPSRNKVPWNDIAYNFVIDPADLKVYEGRGWGVAPGAQKGHNTGTLAICVMGDFRSETPTVGLLKRIAELIVYGHANHGIPLLLTGGHKDAPGQTTTCPGPRLHQKIPTIRLLLEEDDMAFNAHEQETLKQLVAGLDEVDSNGKAIKYAVLHIRQSGQHWTRKQIAAVAGTVGAGTGAVIAEIVNRLGG